MKKCLFGIRAYSGKRDVASAAEEQINYTEFFIVVLGIVPHSALYSPRLT